MACSHGIEGVREDCCLHDLPSHRVCCWCGLNFLPSREPQSSHGPFDPASPIQLVPLNRHRTLLRVLSVKKGRVHLRIPAWSSTRSVTVPRSLFPSNFRLRPKYRFHAYVDIGSSTVAGLNISPPFEAGTTRVPSWASLTRRSKPAKKKRVR